LNDFVLLLTQKVAEVWISVLKEEKRYNLSKGRCDKGGGQKGGINLCLQTVLGCEEPDRHKI